MHKRTRKATGALAPIFAVGVALVFGGCDLGVSNPGAITDESLNDASLMNVVAAGVANEFTILVDGLNLDFTRLTDEAAGTGSYFQTGRLRRGAVDWDETGGDWGQIHETMWTGLSAWDRMSRVEDYDEEKSADAARVWLLIGLAHRMYGEAFCEVIYSVGPSPEEPVLGGVLPRKVAFDSAIVALNRAITIGTAAGSGAAKVVTAARAGLAQAYAAKEEWATALTHAAQVPTSFEYAAIFNRNWNSNDIYLETIGRAEIGLYNSYAGTLASQDPRVPYTICGTFVNPSQPKNSKVTPTGAPGCTSHQGADGVTAHWQQTKYDDWGSDVPVAKGTEMRLIEAEAALHAGDLGTFTARINDVRGAFDLDPINQPVTIGALEYPNAYDASIGDVTAPGVDAWSILDAERHLTLWGEARRTWDLHRWDHPFLDGGIVFWDSEVRRASCYPVPEIECTLNETIKGSTLMTGVGSGTHTCG